MRRPRRPVPDERQHHNRVARTDLAVKEFHAVIDEMWPVDPTAAQASQTRRANRFAKLTDLFDDNAEKLGRTAYAGERAITEYLDHHTTVRPTPSLRGNNLAVRATAVLEGTNDAKKATAHRQLLTLVRK